MLVTYGIAIIEKDVLCRKQESEKDLKANEELKKVYKSIQKWIDINDEKVCSICSNIF